MATLVELLKNGLSEDKGKEDLQDLLRSFQSAKLSCQRYPFCDDAQIQKI